MTVQHAHANADLTTKGDRDGLLRLALKLDAVASGALGLLAAAAAPVLDGLLGIPAALLLPLGLFLVAYAAAVWLTGARTPVSRAAVRGIIGLNALWTVGSLAIVAGGWPALTPLGVVFVVAQAGAVALFAALQLAGLRRLRAAG